MNAQRSDQRDCDLILTTRIISLNNIMKKTKDNCGYQSLLKSILVWTENYNKVRKT